ncbi:hypothetical protein RIF29_28555 [Crotalaria pallida]|uniref:40S ribosomal protein S12 n=1 Tax=Crotalaria pallida TaxID=3830 RepID=A0AAN9EF94_CROPI
MLYGPSPIRPALVLHSFSVPRYFLRPLFDRRSAPSSSFLLTGGKKKAFLNSIRKNVKSQNESLEDGGVAVAAETAATPIPGEPMDIMTALQLVLRKSLAYGGLGRGLHESAKVIEKHAAQLCVLAEDCDQPDYVKLVKALCAEHNVSLLTVPSAKTLGEWAGLCKIDSEGKARKVTGCSCVVVKDFGEEHEAYNVVLQHLLYEMILPLLRRFVGLNNNHSRYFCYSKFICRFDYPACLQ